MSSTIEIAAKDLLTFAFSGAALAISVVALYFNRKQWHLLNRPMVVVRLVTPNPGNVGTDFSLEVTNVGTRPAVDIKLSTDMNLLNAALDPASKKYHDDVLANFSPHAKLDLLKPGESSLSAFGFNSREPNNSTWRCGNPIVIGVRYRDIDGREFSGKYPIVVELKMGISGCRWAEKKA
jgi:hypothetical protein